jgi:hypothetical protein
VLWHPESHERLVETPWRPAAVRDAIGRIVADAERSYDDATCTWPPHPLDVEDEDAGPWLSVYFGSAGVVWALARLGSERDWADVARALPSRYRARPDFGGAHPSLLVGESGVLLVEELVAGTTDRDRLAELVAANVDAEERELMWGSPGTMLAAEVLAGRTGEARWLELWERSADRLLETWDDGGLWLQRLYGRDGHVLGPVHGFAGNVFALARRRDVGARAVAVASGLAQREDGLAQWPPALEPPRDPRSPARTQFCHGAPGMVTALARLEPGDDAWTELLVAGGELTWRAGPHAKGAGLCHGTAGNGYAFLQLLERTGDERWLERARAFAMHAVAQVERARARHGTGRHSLWTGDPGTAVYLRACLDADARVPFYELF